MKADLFMVFDCESIGLHGETFAVGYVVVGRDGTVHAEGRYACPVATAEGDDDGRAWVAEHCPKLVMSDSMPYKIRRAFWRDWLRWKQQGAVLAADVTWPVEARFLAACVDDDPEARGWEGPYPLIDVASVLFAAGLDPLAHRARLNDELPEHDPLADARQSVRLLLEALWVLDLHRSRSDALGEGE